MAFARTLSGKISPVMTHATEMLLAYNHMTSSERHIPMGPQVEAKPAMYKQVRAISDCWPALLSTEIVTPTMAMMNSHIVIHAAPQSKSERRPKRSIPHIPGMVINTLTMFVATDVRKGFLMPACVKNVVPSTERRQQRRTVGKMGRLLTVEDEVDTGELLPRLDEDT